MRVREAAGAFDGSRLRGGFDGAGPSAFASHCVLRDAYDEAAFESLLEERPDLALCSRRGGMLLRSFPALLSDVFCLLFKLRPTLIDRSLVRPAFQVNRYLMARLAGEPHVEGLRAGTTLDEEAAAAGAASLAERLLRELAATRLEQENLLFELEESIDAGGGARKTPAPVRRKSASGGRAGVAGEADGVGLPPLAYDVQQRLEMAEALKGFRSFDRLLALTQELVTRLTNDDPTASQPTEVYDIGLGNELSRLLPGELLSLRASPRRKDFLRRLLGRQLLTYQIAGRQHSGPMVILVDVSHSMTGEKEIASKALAIALSEVAAGRGQPVHVMLFGHRTAPLWHVDFKGRRPQRQQIVALAETFFGGGTDFERPISAAVALVSKRGDGGGQIVLVTDGQCGVGERWLSRVLVLKARNQVRILTVLIDSGPCSDEALASFSDRIVRWSELADPRGLAA
jgi:uncharacterized protein with von Willebrand factor type A (vWA) domain